MFDSAAARRDSVRLRCKALPLHPLYLFVFSSALLNVASVEVYFLFLILLSILYRDKYLKTLRKTLLFTFCVSCYLSRRERRERLRLWR